MRYSKIILAFLCLALIVACKSEKKVTTYEELYKEQPFTILIVPTQDNSKRQQEKNTQDHAVNDELDMAATFMQQTCVEPLVSLGYYAVPPLAGNAILEKYGKSYRQLMLDNISDLGSQYGIDAILLVAIHKWAEPEVNEVVVFAEYTLRSVKSGLELMHTWVRGDKIQPVDDKGDPIELAADLALLQTTEMDPHLAHRCLLLQGMSDFALRNMPTSASRWMFKQDQYTSANPNFYSFLMNTDGSIEREKYNEDAFGNECFTD
jgi:hypothetical protein